MTEKTRTRFKKEKKSRDRKKLNQSDERKRKKDGLLVSSAIQTDGILTGKDGPAGC